ncbi:MAG: hypothetical protein NTW00_11940 [Hyphomicrobiales bacterium]|nr:hypothetical protein [Hyphomicrobiales bacterium]
MSKPAKPVSLAPVKALSTVDTGKPAVVAPALMPAAAASPVADAPAAVSAPVPAPAPKAAVTTAVAAPKAVVPKTLAPVAFAPKSEAPQADAPQADAPQAVPPPAVKAVAKPAARVASPKVAVAKPAAARTSAPKTSAPKVAAPRVVAAPVAASKPATAPKPAAKPAASKPAAGDLFAPMFDMQAMMPSLPSFQLPGFTAADLKSPALGGGMLAVMTGQMLAATRAMGDIQAILLDHGCAELKAGLIELEACARSTSPSEIVTIHARVVRRSADALTDTIKVVSDTARKSLTRR